MKDIFWFQQILQAMCKCQNASSTYYGKPW